MMFSLFSESKFSHGHVAAKFHDIKLLLLPILCLHLSKIHEATLHGNRSCYASSTTAHASQYFLQVVWIVHKLFFNANCAVKFGLGEFILRHLSHLLQQA